MKRQKTTGLAPSVMSGFRILTVAPSFGSSARIRPSARATRLASGPASSKPGAGSTSNASASVAGSWPRSLATDAGEVEDDRRVLAARHRDDDVVALVIDVPHSVERSLIDGHVQVGRLPAYHRIASRVRAQAR